MTRTDVHRPAALVTEDYEYFGSGYFGTMGEPGFSPLNTPVGEQLLADGWGFGGESGGGCDHCGARLKYYALLLHGPSHTIIRVGETCLDSRFALASAEFHRLRKEAALDRAAQRIKRTRAAWFASDEDREVAFVWASEQVEDGHYGYEGMRHKFVSSVNRYGSTSERFVRAIMRDMARTERFAAERAARDAADAENRSPVVAGQGVRIEGEIVSTKTQENDFGTRLVWTVKDDRGFLVWGTVPSAAMDGSLLKGQRVSFVANVEASDRDECFGFAKRPRKVQLGQEVVAA